MLYKGFFFKFQEFALASVFDLCFCGTLYGMWSSFTRYSRILITCYVDPVTSVNSQRPDESDTPAPLEAYLLTPQEWEHFA